MSQTDRQTDKKKLAELRQKRSTWWEVTVWIPEMIEKIQDPSTYPACVKAVHGGLEKGEESGGLHFQGAIECHAQTRGAAINDWLPRTHFDVARSAEALRKYCMKSETAVGDKSVRANPIKYYTADEICLLIGSKVTDADIEETIDAKVWFKRSINILLRENVKLAGQLMNPSLRNFWCDTCRVWIDKSREVAKVNEIVMEEEGSP